MIFISWEDFYTKAKDSKRLSQEEERALSLLAKSGDEKAMEYLIESYLSYVASNVKKYGKEFCTLDFVYRCINEIELELRAHDFQKEGNNFLRKIRATIKKKVVEKIADK